MITNLKIKLADIKDRHMFVKWSETEREEIFRFLLTRISQQDFCELFDIDDSIFSEVKTGKIKPSGYIYLSILDFLGIKKDVEGLVLSGRSHQPIRIKKAIISPELIGLIHTDGHMNLNKRRNGVNFYFCNKNFSLVKKFKELVLATFDCSFLEYMDARDQTKHIHPPSIIARILAKKVGWKDEPRIKDIKQEEVPGYLRGVFDGDGTITIGNNKYSGIAPKIKICSASVNYSSQLSNLLLRLGINSKVRSMVSKKGHKWCITEASRHRDILLFINKIGSSHIGKKKKQQFVKNVLLNGNQVPSLHEFK
ncbi:hypothetical protein HYU11_00655 [Candidatus Woesearchaeota archaeon]|nr:hypothetical protein [Candidatus Woesearchaeota archaeon]